MHSIHTFIWISIICYIISIVIDIVAISLGSVGAKIDSCDNTDHLTGLNVNKYLIVGGVVNILFSFILIIFVSFTSRRRVNDILIANDIKYYTMTYPVALMIMFNIVWCIIVGGIILFHSNNDCIVARSTHVCFGVWFFIVSILRIIRECIVLPVSHSFVYE